MGTSTLQRLPRCSSYREDFPSSFPADVDIDAPEANAFLNGTRGSLPLEGGLGRVFGSLPLELLFIHIF
jgi:hypothetical protein